MSKDIREARLDLFVVAYPHEEDDLYNLHLEGRLGDEVIFDEPLERCVSDTIFNQIARNLEGDG